MSKKLNKCKSGKDFVNYAKRQGLDVKPGRGSHQKVYGHTRDGRRTMMTVPVHGNEELGTGLRRKIAKWFMLLACLFFVYVCAAILLGGPIMQALGMPMP